MKVLRSALFALAATLLFSALGYAQQYQIIRAEYGAGNRWVDVTNQLKRIASSSTTFRMGNSTFGVDPAPGQVKTLRILARSRSGGGFNRTFEYREGSTVDGSLFSGWGGGDWGRPDDHQYRIVRAEYGAGNRWIDVTNQLKRIASTDATFRMGNSTFGVDPAPGQVKTLRILARSRRGNRTFEYREGDTVDGAQFSSWSGGEWGGGGGDWGGSRGEYRITRAEYGADNRWVDVTQKLRSIASTDRTFRMGNSTFGIDPAPGRVKTLRILARDPRGGNRTFEYREGDTVDGSQFSGWSGGDWGGGGGGYPGGGGEYRIVRAEYGADNRWVDVTQKLRSIASTDRTFRMGNSTFGIDPAPGRVKTLRIFARDPRGGNRTFQYREGDTVDGSQFSGWNGGDWGPRQ